MSQQAETLMIIVPDNDILEVTASVLNKDIGFIQPGQEVVIKVDAYPYTRHGYLTGKVKNITADSVSVRIQDLYLRDYIC